MSDKVETALPELDANVCHWQDALDCRERQLLEKMALIASLQAERDELKRLNQKLDAGMIAITQSWVELVTDLSEARALLAKGGK